MSRLFLSAVAVCCLFACTPKRIAEASSTIEDLPNEPVAAADAGAPEPTAAAAPIEELPPPPPTVTFARFEAPEGFAVMMPAGPQVQRNEVALKKGKVQSMSASVTADGAIYSASRSDYPEGFVKSRGPRLLAEVRTGLAAQLKGTVSEEVDMPFQGYSGQVFTVASATKMVKARSALVGTQVFTLLVAYSGKLPDRADEFLNSLELNPSAAPVPAPAPAAAPK